MSSFSKFDKKIVCLSVTIHRLFNRLKVGSRKVILLLSNNSTILIPLSKLDIGNILLHSMQSIVFFGWVSRFSSSGYGNIVFLRFVWLVNLPVFMFLSQKFLLCHTKKASPIMSGGIWYTFPPLYSNLLYGVFSSRSRCLTLLMIVCTELESWWIMVDV